MPPTPTPLPPTDTPTPEVYWQPEPNATQVARSGEFVDNDDCADLTFTSRLPDTLLTIRVGDVGLQVVAEVANSGSERSQGLMCRRRLSDGTGMLFVFRSESRRNFWMFNTYVSLDIVYLDGDRRPVSARTMSPCPRPSGADDGEWSSRCSEAATGYGSGADARYALELPAGWLRGETGLSLRRIVDEAVFDW